MAKSPAERVEKGETLRERTNEKMDFVEDQNDINLKIKKSKEEGGKKKEKGRSGDENAQWDRNVPEKRVRPSPKKRFTKR